MPLVPDIVLVFKLNDERKELHYRKVPFSAWSELKQQLGFTAGTLIGALGTVDLEAIGAVIWLERKQHERSLRWTDVRGSLERDEYDFEAVDVITDGESMNGEDDDPAPPEEDAEPDPTPAGA